jgi:hypothetical protein
MTTYFTYASALQAGDLAPGTAASAGTAHALSQQGIRLGYKASLREDRLYGGLFHIERPFANIDPVTRLQDRRPQVNRAWNSH